MKAGVPSQTAGFAHPPRNVELLGIEPGMLVADFGSGSGAYVLAIAERLQNLGHVYAIDVQRDLLRRTANEATKAGFKTVEVIWADLEMPNASKLASNTLDVVLISNLLFQVPDKQAILSEAYRILKKTGRLIVIDWSDSFGNLGPIKEDVVKKDAVLVLAQKVGFALAQEFSAGAHHYGLIFRVQ
ncbi:class I SAM-dependent methyltransferase [Candidatus Parcubacteria bacterium]|nr:MAG: class I SAM-dependent methyltransferase [Candidatus Parcubacteria bacterium]